MTQPDIHLTTTPANTLLQASRISKHFGGIAALTNVSLTIRQNEIYGLIGPNGAGKTSLFNILTGLYIPDSGSVTLNGVDLTAKKPHEIAMAGIARTFQNIRLFANMTVLENVMTGRHLHTHAGVFGAILRNQTTRLEEAGIRQSAIRLLEYTGIAPFADTMARHLSYGDQRRLEIARALATEPVLLALDEPAAGMNASETATLRQLLETIRNDGTTILLIEHDVRLIMGLCNRIAVLDYGKKIAEDVPTAVQHDPAVIAAYLGA